jgi:hypothetical protein
MPSPHSFSFNAFPNDNRIYRLYWGGEIQLPNSQDESSLVYVWLREIDINGKYILNTTDARRVVLSSGAIPRLHIGSLWRAQAPYTSRAIPESQLLEFEIEAQPTWQPVRAGARNHAAGKGNWGESHAWINPSDYLLRITEDARQVKAGYNAWVVPMRTVGGVEVIVPCFEIFRAFYAGSSEMAWRLLSAPWPTISHRFIKTAEFIKGPDGLPGLLIDPAPGLGQGVVRSIAALVSSIAARQGANNVSSHLLHEAQEHGQKTAWIHAVPPFINTRFRMNARVQKFASRDGYLVTKIENASYPSDIRHIEFLQDIYEDDPLNIQNVSDEDPSEGIPHQKENLQHAQINQAGDRRPTSGRFYINTGSDLWLDPPIVEKIARSQKHLSKQNDHPSVIDIPIQTVGVGGQGNYKSAKHASFESTIKLEKVDRMAAAHELISALHGKSFDSWDEYPLVDPVSDDMHTYCSLPINIGDAKAKAWAQGNVYTPSAQSRLAWVVRLNIGNQAVYWIELEHLKNSDKYCSLAVKTRNGSELNAETLKQILDICVKSLGIWPENAPKTLAENILWVKAKHYTNKEGKLRESTINNRLTELGFPKFK